MKKLTTKEFVKKAKEIHGEKYDYSKVQYLGSHKKVKIICKKHGVFKQTPLNHTSSKSKCPKCSQEEKITSIDEFIIKAKSIHNDYYDYSLVQYKTLKDKVKIICTKHGIFEQIASTHLAGRACKNCYFEKLMSNKNEFINKSNKKHKNKYDYSLVEYFGANKKIKIICPTHGIFEQTPSNHASGAGCLSCRIDKTRITIQQMIKKSRIIHGKKYDYSLVEYAGTKGRVKIICPIHGIFEQTMDSHMSGCGCPKCNSSHGEREIRKVLEKNNIIFKEQKTFDDCVNKKTNKKLPFDFYLLEYNICIEFDGIQHIKMKSFGEKNEERKNENFLKIKINDEIKNDYCKNKKIKLLRIKHFEIKNVENIINNFLNIDYEKN